MLTDFLIAFPFCIGFVEMIYGYEMRHEQFLRVRRRILAQIGGHNA
jgi:hypothetical protein